MPLIYKASEESSKHRDIVKLLSQAYEDGIESDHHKGVLALILAIKRQDRDFISGLLKRKNKLVSYSDNKGWTPLHYAAYYEFDSILQIIIAAQKEIQYKFVYERMITPFHVAVKCEHTSTVIRLMQIWPTSSHAYTSTDENGQNILHLAAAAVKNKEKMIDGILKNCPRKYRDQILKQIDDNGDTPLHVLISHGCYISELISYKGLDATAKNKKGWTPRDMLYCQTNIVGDQVRIKFALDNIHTTQSAWNLWPKSTKNMDNWKSIVPPGDQNTKDVMFHEHRKGDLNRYKTRTNTQIIVTALITTVTFTVGFAMPGGLYQSGVNEGLVILSRKTAFNAFVVSNALALLLSTSSLFFYFLESMNEDPHQIAKLNAASTILNIVSVIAMMLTFITGTYVVLSHSPVLAIAVCSMSSLFFLVVIVLFIKVVFDCKIKRNKD